MFYMRNVYSKFWTDTTWCTATAWCVATLIKMTKSRKQLCCDSEAVKGKKHYVHMCLFATLVHTSCSLRNEARSRHTEKEAKPTSAVKHDSVWEE